jgi:aspartyl aminopeptidase
MNVDIAQDLLDFIDASPTPWHAVKETIRRLHAAGYRSLDERDAWTLSAGDKIYVVRGGTSIAAFHLGSEPLDHSGFRLVGAHTDSPNLRLKPNPVYNKVGYSQLGVEVYGGVLWHTWLDRDLSMAGRVVVAAKGGTESHLVDFGRGPLLRIPNLAIHLNRQVNQDGLKLNPQEHLAPMWALESSGTIDLRALIADQLAQGGVKVEPTDVLAWDLCLYDVQRSSRSGLRGEFLHAPRLDNLASSHASLTALLSAAHRKSTCGAILFDHEEVGSTSAQGAASPFLRDVLERIAASLGGLDRPGFLRTLQNSFLVSADMAHALHPNYADKHEPRHQPMLGGGPVIKSNANQSYATDAETLGYFLSLCRDVGVVPQHFVTRTDLACGSTIGPISAGELGIRTIDIGSPMMSMHSIREMAAATDVEKMVSVLRRFYS